MSIKKPFVIPLALLAAATALGAQTRVLHPRIKSQAHDFSVSSLFQGLEHPWAMAFISSRDILVTERPGRLLRLQSADGEQWTVSHVTGTPPVFARGQGGLLDIALAPDFSRTSLVYLTFAKPGAGGAGTAVGVGKLVDNRLENFRTLWEMTARTSSTVHFGSRLQIGPDGDLYFSVSDRGDMERAQDPKDPAGSILRLRPDGSPAAGPWQASAWLPGLYSMGHRNIQGLTFSPDGRLWATEHGPRGGDEVNLIRPGENYGWPRVTHGLNYNGTTISPRNSRPGLTDPVVVWTPSIAPSGLTWYPGGAFSGWAGNLFSGNLAGQELRRLVLEDDRVVAQESLLKNLLGRIRDVRTGPDGLIYLLTDEARGHLLVLRPIVP